MADPERIKALEKEAAPLEPGPEARKSLRDTLLPYTEEFLNKVDDLPAFVESEDKGKGLLESPIGEEGIEPEKALGLIRENVDTPGLNPASGGHLGYIPGGGIYHAALGDYMAAISNRYAGIFFGSPGAVRMENQLLDWMKDVVGYPETTLGNIASGGSIGNLSAIVAARDAHDLKGKDLERTVIYATEHVHHCMNKAFRIAGLRECILRHVPMDEHYRMDPSELESMIQEDRSSGKQPFLVVASAGTTDTGAIDPLDQIADVTNEQNLWYHIDGAYGAFFMLCEEGKTKLKGIERSDSLVMDPHKGLFLPYGTGVVLVRNGKHLFESHHYLANYMQDALTYKDEVSPADLSPELTKHFRGMRTWLPLKLLGIKPFRACLQEKLELARYFHEEVGKIPGFEIGPDPDLSVVMFRYLPQNGDADEYNLELMSRIRKNGQVFFSSTKVDGKIWIRAAILSFRTHLKTIHQGLKMLKDLTMS